MRIINSERAYRYLRRVINFEQEEFWVMALGTQKQLLAMNCLFRGSINSCPVYSRDVMRYSLLHNALAILLAHSHPEGDLMPSKQDIQATIKIAQAAEITDLILIDHLVITKDSYFSFVDYGLKPFDRPDPILRSKPN